MILLWLLAGQEISKLLLHIVNPRQISLNKKQNETKHIFPEEMVSFISKRN